MTGALDGLLLVFILVELFGAVRTTVAERTLVAEPFLVVGIIAPIKEIVVVVAEGRPTRTGDEFDERDHRARGARRRRPPARGEQLPRPPQGTRADRGMSTAEPSTTFAHAVASFEPTSAGVLIWTRLSGGHTEAEWMVATDPGLHEVVASGTATTGPDRDHTITVDVDGLAPATTYWYGFRVDGDASPVGRTRTLPGAGASGFRMATVSCARYSVAPLGVYRAVAEREVDLVLHLGDYLYEDDGSHGPRSHDRPTSR